MRATSSKKTARRHGCTAQPPSTSSAPAEKRSDDISARVLMIDRADRARSGEGAQSVGRCLDADATQKINGCTGVQTSLPRQHVMARYPAGDIKDETEDYGLLAEVGDEASDLREQPHPCEVAPAGACSTVDEPCRRSEASTTRASCKQGCKAECTGSFRAPAHSMTKCTTRCSRAPGRSRCFRTPGHLVGCCKTALGSKSESDCHNLQPGWPGAWQSGFYQEILFTAISAQTRQDLPKL